MEHVISLTGYIKDEFTPDVKEIPDRIQKQVLLDCEMKLCPMCETPLHAFYTTKARKVVTILFDLSLQVKYKCCVNPECFACRSKVGFHNPELERTVLPQHRYALDVTLLLGHLIYKDHKTEFGAVDHLLKEHGIAISQPEVNYYKRLALAISEATMVSDPAKVKARLDELPMRIYTVDGTSSDRSKTLFIIREAITGTVLGTALLIEHDEVTIHKFLEGVFRQFGRPDYMVGDAESGLIAAVRNCYPDIQYHYCHQHFLKNMGKALMEDLAKGLNKAIKKKLSA